LAYTLQISDAPYNRSDYVELGRRSRSLLILDKILNDREDLHIDLIYEPAGSPSVKFQKLDKRSNGESDAFKGNDKPRRPLIPLLENQPINFDTDPTIKTVEMPLFLFRQTVGKAITDLTRVLHPYLLSNFPNGIRDIQSKFHGRGIVISTGKWHFKLAYHAIKSFHQVLKSPLPVEVLYAGPNDLTDAMIQAFNALPNVKTVDILEYFGEESKDARGWAIKPFAMLASSFAEIIFIDADGLFFQDPNVLFEKSQLYKRDGALFFFDRTMRTDEETTWLNSYLLHPSKYAKGNRYLTKKSIHEMESGVVVMDKSRTDVLHGLLAVCKMNSAFERDAVTYKHMHGMDKPLRL
jgi:hypothetical protein